MVPARARSGTDASIRPLRLWAAGSATPSSATVASPNVAFSFIGHGPGTAPVSCSAVPSVASRWTGAPDTSAAACRRAGPAPASSVACGTSATMVRPVTPSCQVTRPDSTTSRSSSVGCRWTEADGVALGCPAGRWNCQLPRPEASVSKRISGRTSVTRAISTCPVSKGSSFRTTAARATVAICGRVPPGMLASETSSASSTGVRPQPIWTGPARVSVRPVARCTAAAMRSFCVFGVEAQRRGRHAAGQHHHHSDRHDQPALRQIRPPWLRPLGCQGAI